MGMLELTGRVKMDNNFEYIFSYFSSVDGKKNIYIYHQIEAKTNNNNNNSIPKFCIMSFNFQQILSEIQLVVVVVVDYLVI